MITLRKFIHIFNLAIRTLPSSRKHKKHKSNKRKMMRGRRDDLNNHIPSDQTSFIGEAKQSANSTNTVEAKEVPAFIHESALPVDIKQQRTFNVVLMAVSIFNSRDNRIKQSRYMYNGESFGYQSQAEPVIRYISQELQLSNPSDCIDRLILLCSDKAEEKKAVICPDGTSVTISPKDFLTSRIKERMNPAISEDNYFKTISIDVQNPAPAILDAIDELRNLHKEYGDSLRLYIDQHGGLRGIQQIMGAMLSLIKNEITIRGFYDVEYDNNVAVITLKDSADIFDFVSGINEFSNYARIASLNQYYSDLGNIEISRKAEKLMRPIRKIAESIQLCDIPAFEDGLNELRAYYIHLDNASIPDTSAFEQQQRKELSYLSLFQKNIRQDYAELLTDNRSISAEVSWCLKKGFYQQALTLIEGRMPEELHEKCIFSYSQRVSDYVEDFRKYFKPNVFVINHSIPYTIQKALGKNKNTIEPTVLGLLRTPEVLDDIWAGNSHTRRASNFVNRIKFFYIASSNEALDRWENPFSENIALCRASHSQLFAFFLLHLGFKYLRNTYNHAGDESPNISTQDIDLLIEKYIDWKSQLEIVAANQNI